MMNHQFDVAISTLTIMLNFHGSFFTLIKIRTVLSDVTILKKDMYIRAYVIANRRGRIFALSSFTV